MAHYSSNTCEYSYPASTSGAPYSSSQISQTEINQMLHTLRSHRVNTLTELRRIEKVLASVNPLAYYAPMTEAWNHYVSSNNFLSELRGLTRQYPFSTELLESAKWSVYNDPDSSKSWNFAWLILTKLRNEQMVAEFATKTAYEPAMWGNATPDPASATQLASVLTQEWSKAVDQMLRHWSSPPTTDSFY
ncbi:hypothetical protein P167DRAFT_480794 [Morchella conica CCBAS932]|uniref:Uncharacterized protein n=2 Tax=Morchella sect. Distantes TaxID=1051054 RepID=A0A3N4L124_9PEZI|nr:hypothetical protein P167DRAFT_480794 [Morchella conica CCBAS932]